MRRRRGRERGAQVRRAYTAIICLFIVLLVGCRGEQDPVSQLRGDVRANPDSVEARLKLADAYIEDGAYHDAFIQYSAARNIDERSFDAALGVAAAQERLNDVEGAIEQVNRALAINPEAAAALALKGKLMLRTDQTDRAVQLLSEALAADPDNLEAHRYLPVAYLRNNQAFEAERAARAAVEKMPDVVDAQINLAIALLAQEKAEESEAVLRRTMELAPADPAPPLRLAELLVREGRELDEAVELAERSTELDPGGGEAEAVAALALRRQGRDEEAARRLHAAAMTHPRNVRLWLMLASIYRDLGEEAASARAAAMAFRFAPRRRVRGVDPGAATDGSAQMPSMAPLADGD